MSYPTFYFRLIVLHVDGKIWDRSNKAAEFVENLRLGEFFDESLLRICISYDTQF